MLKLRDNSEYCTNGLYQILYKEPALTADEYTLNSGDRVYQAAE